MSKKSWPILYSKLLYKMGQDLLDILYIQGHEVYHMSKKSCPFCPREKIRIWRLFRWLEIISEIEVKPYWFIKQWIGSCNSDWHMWCEGMFANLCSTLKPSFLGEKIAKARSKAMLSSMLDLLSDSASMAKDASSEAESKVSISKGFTVWRVHPCKNHPE